MCGLSSTESNCTFTKLESGPKFAMVQEMKIIDLIFQIMVSDFFLVPCCSDLRKLDN